MGRDPAGHADLCRDRRDQRRARHGAALPARHRDPVHVLRPRRRDRQDRSQPPQRPACGVDHPPRRQGRADPWRADPHRCAAGDVARRVADGLSPQPLCDRRQRRDRVQRRRERDPDSDRRVRARRRLRRRRRHRANRAGAEHAVGRLRAVHADRAGGRRARRDAARRRPRRGRPPPARRLLHIPHADPARGAERVELVAELRLRRTARRWRRRRREAADPQAERNHDMSHILGVQRRLPLLQLLALVVLFVYGAETIDGFSTQISVDSILVLAALLGLAALGQTLVLILGGLDLSVPGHIVMGAILVSELYGRHHWSAPLAIAFAVVAAAILGGATGWICHRWRIQPLIVTLGVGAISAGAAVAWTHGQLTGTAPQFLTKLTTANGTTFGIQVPPIVVIWGVVTIIAGVVLHRTTAGRRLYATGANPRAAVIARVDTKRVWVLVFATSAIISALVGCLLAGFAGPD